MGKTKVRWAQLTMSSCPAASSGEATTLKLQNKKPNTRPVLLLFPSSEEPRQLLPIKVSRSLEQALGKLNLSSKDEAPDGSCTGSDELMDSSGVARGKFSMGFYMAGSARDDGSCMLSTCRPTELCQRHVAMDCFQRLCMLSWRAGRGAGLGTGACIAYPGVKLCRSHRGQGCPG